MSAVIVVTSQPVHMQPFQWGWGGGWSIDENMRASSNSKRLKPVHMQWGWGGSIESIWWKNMKVSSNSNQWRHFLTSGDDWHLSNNHYQVVKSSNHKIIKSSNHQITKSSKHQIIKSSKHQIIMSSDHQITKSSNHQITSDNDWPLSAFLLLSLTVPLRFSDISDILDIPDILDILDILSPNSLKI